MRRKFRKPLTKRQRRHVRVRAKVSGTQARPRLNVFRSSAHIYAQVIDDDRGHTILAASDLEPEVRERAGADAKKSDSARAVGEIGGERLAAAASFEVWNRLRTTQGLEVEAAAKVVQAMVEHAVA